MKVVVTSIVRDGASYLGRYFGQVRVLRGMLARRGHTLAAVLGEGDSVDGSWGLMGDFVLELGNGSRVVDVSHGGRAFGSVDDATRWGQIAGCWNRLYGELAADVFDAVIYVEADLLWEPEMMVRLLGHLTNVPAVAPMSFHRNGFFYDVWGHRGLDGVHFTPFAPYHGALAEARADELVQVASAGSCMVMLGEVARQCRFAMEDAMLGHAIYEEGWRLWLDARERVEHP